MVVIVGGGEGGLQLALVLRQAGRPFRVIESRRAVIPGLRQRLGPHEVLLGNATDPAVLLSAGIHEAAVLVALTGSDATNLAVAQLGRFAFGVPRTVARVNSPRHAWLFKPELGVDVALDPSEILAQLLLGQFNLGEIPALLRLRLGNYLLHEARINPGSPAAGRSLKELDLPVRCSVVAVVREGRLLVPRGGTVLQPGDEVLALVHEELAPTVAAALGGPAGEGP
jgi:trk system potassium uptake protein TrkA